MRTLLGAIGALTLLVPEAGLSAELPGRAINEGSPSRAALETRVVAAISVRSVPCAFRPRPAGPLPHPR